jgi:hypothetical protein
VDEGSVVVKAGTAIVAAVSATSAQNRIGNACFGSME